MSDLSKFGVGADGSGGARGILQPKLTYKFRVVFNGFGISKAGATILTQAVQAVSRPTWSQEEAEVHSYNSRAYIGGKHAWETIELTCRDNLDNSVVSMVGEQLQKQVNHYEQTSAVAAYDYKFHMEIQSLDGTHGNAVEQWDLDGCWITGVNYGEADYTQVAELQTVVMTIRFDNATQIDGNSVVDTVGGNPFPDNIIQPSGIADALGGFLTGN